MAPNPVAAKGRGLAQGMAGSIYSLLPIIANKGTMDMDEKTRTELEAAAFRGLVAHLQRRTDAQNIDIMNLAGFCRNCLSKWYRAAAQERGVEMSDDEARAAIYGMSYSEWKDKYQREASDKQKAKFQETKPLHAIIIGHN